MATLTALTACGRGVGAADPNASSDLVGEIRGVSTTSQPNVQDAWMNTFMGANPRATVDYVGGGSGAGRAKPAEGVVDFAGTNTPITADEISRTGSAVELPLYISPIAMTYSLPGFTGKSHINMTGEAPAKALSGAIARRNNPTLATLDLGATLSDLRVIVVGRPGGSDTTKVPTTYLATIVPETWLHEPEETRSLRGGQSDNGTASMIQTVSAATGTIDYADVPKVPATLGTVAVGSNEAYVSVPAKAAAAAPDAATLGSETDETRLLYQSSYDAKDAYLIVLVSHLTACLRYDDARVTAVIKAYLRLTASARGQDASTKTTDCVPITRQMREKISAAIGKIAA